MEDCSTTPSIVMPAVSSACTSTALRVVPYDSPKRNLGEAVRALAASQRVTKSRKTLASASTPQKLWLVLGAMAVDRPLPIASTKTRSLTSSRLCALSTKGNGAGVVVFGSPVARRLGAKEPRCSHTLAEPGP